jgi:hypothetical protein
MAVYLPKGGKTWRYDFTVEGTPFKGSTGKQTEAEARKFEADLKAQAQAQAKQRQQVAAAKAVLGIADEDPNKAVPKTFGEAAARYWKEKGQYASNAKEDKEHLLRLGEWIGADTALTSINNATVASIVARRADMPKLSKPHRDPKTGEIVPGRVQVRSPVTGQVRDYVEGEDNPQHIIRLSKAFVNRSSIDLLKRVMLRARDTWECPGLRAIKWKEYRLKEAKPRKRTLTYAEEAKIEEHLREGYRAAFRFAVRSGFRLENFAGEFAWKQVIPIGADPHALTQSRRPMDMVRCLPV